MAESKKRYKISKKNRVVLDRLKETKYLGPVNSLDVKNKDIFLYSLALGKDSPTDLEGADQWFEDSDMSIEERAVVYSIVYDVTNDVDMLLDFEKVRSLADRMSNTGLMILEEKISSGTLDNVEKKMISELNKLYESLEL